MANQIVEYVAPECKPKTVGTSVTRLACDWAMCYDGGMRTSLPCLYRTGRLTPRRTLVSCGTDIVRRG